MFNYSRVLIRYLVIMNGSGASVLSDLDSLLSDFIPGFSPFRFDTWIFSFHILYLDFLLSDLIPGFSPFRFDTWIFSFQIWYLDFLPSDFIPGFSPFRFYTWRIQISGRLQLCIKPPGFLPPIWMLKWHRGNSIPLLLVILSTSVRYLKLLISVWQAFVNSVTFWTIHNIQYIMSNI